jgi:hypothetical protein
MKLTLKYGVKNAKTEGKIVEYPVDGIEEICLFLKC